MKKLSSLVLVLLLSQPCFAVKFKTKELQNQFNELEKKNKPLHMIISAIDKTRKEHFNKEITLTEIYRTQEEQEKIYGKSASISPHQLWDAVDIRTRDMSDDEIRNIMKSVKLVFNGMNVYHTTVIFHDIGLGPHLHIQFRYAE